MAIPDARKEARRLLSSLSGNFSAERDQLGQPEVERALRSFGAAVARECERLVNDHAVAIAGLRGGGNCSTYDSGLEAGHSNAADVCAAVARKVEGK